MAIQPTQPQGVGGVLDTAFQLYKSSLSTVWPIALLTALISLLPSVVSGVRPEGIVGIRSGKPSPRAIHRIYRPS